MPQAKAKHDGIEMSIVLLSGSEMGSRPQQFYAVVKAPGLLAGMSYPNGTDWNSLHGMGYRHVVRLTGMTATYDPAPLSVLYAAALQDLAGGAVPHKPDYEERCIREAVSLIVPRVRAGEGVAVHCAGGTGRTGTVLACSLKVLGVRLEDVIDHMSTVNAARTKYSGWGWPESPWQKAMFERF